MKDEWRKSVRRDIEDRCEGLNLFGHDEGEQSVVIDFRPTDSQIEHGTILGAMVRTNSLPRRRRCNPKIFKRNLAINE